ncbi:MAG: hypothetical protein HGJ94_17250 [Desulfosarcina sp.]|nr:hypothetical protein [Desulfosarcina sp.]
MCRHECPRQAIIEGLYALASISTDESYISWLVIRRAILDLGQSRAPGWPQGPAPEAWFRCGYHAGWAVQAGLDPDGVVNLLRRAGLI